jgi:hypothetical protein
MTTTTAHAGGSQVIVLFPIEPRRHADHHDDEAGQQYRAH